MATILLTWELGSGMGHILPLRALGEALVKRGHRVIAALRDVRPAAHALAGTGVSFIPAPHFVRSQLKPAFDPPAGFAHILANVGFHDPVSLESLFLAWNTVFDMVQPDLVVSDHSPTALLALRGRSIRKVNLGLAFYCPPEGFPLPYWSLQGSLNPRLQVENDERTLTHQVNQLLAKYGRPAVKHLSNLFTQLDGTFLGTFEEFDHFAGRPRSTRYWGHWHSGAGVAPRWPEGNSAAARKPRVFAYLKPFPAVDVLLNKLASAATSTIVLSGGLPESLQRKYAGRTLRFENDALEMTRVANECDIAVLNAGHGTTASVLLAGKPMLLVPLYVEQLLNSQAIERLGAGRWVLPNAWNRMGPALDDVLTNARYREGATAFAAKYAGFVPGQQLPEIADHLERLLGK